MNAEEAQKRLAAFLNHLAGDVAYSPPADWSATGFQLVALANGDWIALPPTAPEQGIVLRDDGGDAPFYGALGKMVPALGLPRSREMLLGSTELGRYQTYERGLAIWETVTIDGIRRDAGFPVATWPSTGKRARTSHALVAFFDLRGFTAWSRERNADDIQGIIELLESSFQDAFSRRWCQRLFVKSTGDGFMLVSEAGWYAAGGETLPSGFQNGHVRAFCRDCAQTISLARGRLPKELAVGCGITAGAVNQLYLLGRVDYLGAIINEASKIQSLAYDELCISDATSKYLEAEGFVLSGKAVHGKGIRCDPDALSSA